MEDLLIKIKVEGVKQGALLNDLFRTVTPSRPRAMVTTERNLDEPVEMRVSTAAKRSSTTVRHLDFYP